MCHCYKLKRKYWYKFIVKVSWYSVNVLFFMIKRLQKIMGCNHYFVTIIRKIGMITDVLLYTS